MKNQPRETTRRSTRLGRPPLARETARSNRVVTFVTDKELRELRRNAERASCSLSSHVHELIVQALTGHAIQR